MYRNKTNRLMPLFMAICDVVGILIGTFYANHFSGNRLNIINTSGNKLNNLLHIIDDQYVDAVNIDSLVDKAIPLILSELDPHSVYISAKDVAAATDDLKGSFCGVGIEFVIRDDTIHVQNVIQNGPAEKAGLLAGDKIVAVDGKPFVGKIVTNEEAMHRLKGQKDTKVKIGVVRYGSKKVQTFTVTRGEIPTKSITATYMLDDKTGYIRVKKFSETTYAELLISLAKLSQSGFTNLVIDLRDNTGGYLETAVQMANEFLPKGKIIVYTEGRKSPRQDYISNGHGSYQDIPLIVLINEGSASASEIFAGAIQDNDRGTIVGRRSFGKGLVQESKFFNDGSGIRLTIARFYTPSGRCIQKPYSSDYQYDIYKRYADGEMFDRDSIKVDSTEIYHTVGGRTVYGGGGIVPDVFVPVDTTLATKYFIKCNKKATQMRFASYIFDKYGKRLSSIDNYPQLDAFLDELDITSKFQAYAASAAGIKAADGEWKMTAPYMVPQLRALIGRYSKLSDNAFYRIYLEIDDVVKAAL